jgi:hypothetical protein
MIWPIQMQYQCSLFSGGLFPDVGVLEFVRNCLPASMIICSAEPSSFPANQPGILAPLTILPCTIFSRMGFILAQATRDERYLRYGEIFMDDLYRHNWAPGGWASLRSVATHEKEDHMHSFFLAETCKYLFLLYNDTFHKVPPPPPPLSLATSPGSYYLPSELPGRDRPGHCPRAWPPPGSMLVLILDLPPRPSSLLATAQMHTHLLLSIRLS